MYVAIESRYYFYTVIRNKNFAAVIQSIWSINRNKNVFAFLTMDVVLNLRKNTLIKFLVVNRINSQRIYLNINIIIKALINNWK